MKRKYPQINKESLESSEKSGVSTGTQWTALPRGAGWSGQLGTVSTAVSAEVLGAMFP